MQYCAEVRIIVKDERLFQPMTEGCEVFGPFSAVVNSAVTFSCPSQSLHPGAKQVTWRTIQGQETFPTTHCPSLCNSSSAQRPLCERARVLKNGSLTISPVDFQDALWYWCAGNASACSRFKLNVTEKHFTSLTKIISVSNKVTSKSQTTQYLSETAGSSREETVDVSSNVTVVVTASTVSVLIIMALLLAVGFSLKKHKRKGVSKIELENQFAAYEDIVANDNFVYSYINEPAKMCTFT
ncbi:uncharacterized protein LOC113571905 [Electrophorus electricus]|uniref:uncharacterized protein LOC113571905 n=1 Tax=Electrophorus electricus TaxID=8005 RepID=UPI0015D042E2|nr:uncharacterized protein LOC113571905 [Electrophorus electricus]